MSFFRCIASVLLLWSPLLALSDPIVWTENPDCVINKDYYINGDPLQNCVWIANKESRREEACLSLEVHINCPIACGSCCENDPNYLITIKSGKEKTCEWLEKSADRQEKWCADSGSNKFDVYQNGKLVRNGCPKACDHCREFIQYNTPTWAPSNTPSMSPSMSPSISSEPTVPPSDHPSKAPSQSPSLPPTDSPSLQPSVSPSDEPTNVPTIQPSDAPSQSPSLTPTDEPSYEPTSSPSDSPSLSPTASPSSVPSSAPSDKPSGTPSSSPSSVPSSDPTPSPSSVPSSAPSDKPSDHPTLSPSSAPSSEPSTIPSEPPSDHPSDEPSQTPTDLPSVTPSDVPSLQPSDTPTNVPSVTPTTSRFPSPLPSISANPTMICIDDVDFRWNNVDYKSCEWISNKEARREKLCIKKTVHRSCPLTCGVCCQDSTDFTFTTELGDTQDCDWLSKKIVRPQTYCDTENDEGVLIKDECLKTCDNCFSYLSTSPSVAPCADDPDFTFVTDLGRTRDCAFIAEKEKRITKYCPETYDGVAIEDACPITCSNCDE